MPGDGDSDYDCAEEPHFERRRVLDHREIRTAMVEHHNFMNHGQLKMRCGIVHRDTSILRKKNDTQARNS